MAKTKEGRKERESGKEVGRKREKERKEKTKERIQNESEKNSKRIGDLGQGRESGKIRDRGKKIGSREVL